MTMICLILANFSHADLDPPDNPLAPPDPAALKRWQDSRLGMFIHWGPISQLGTEIGWSRGGARPDGVGGTGAIPVEKYDNLYRTFNPTKFDANEWVRIAKSAGMKYIVIVAKHHDGFCMFDSKLTDYKITNSPFQRDVCAELAAACHAAGISLGFYYSPPDWHNPDFIKNEDQYIQYMHGQVRELLTNYGQVDILWFDHDGGRNTPEMWGDDTLFPMIRELQPQILVTKRAGGWGDFNTPEQKVGSFDNKNPWESCMTISSSNAWAWGGDKDGVKPLAEILKMLVNCAGGDGNMILNIGPQPDGEINAQQAGRLKEMGEWLGKYGESIYGTRGGPYKPATWCASTCKDNIIYLHVFTWSGDSLVLPPISKKILKAELLGGGTVNYHQDDAGLTISVPPSDRQEIDTVVKLELDGPAQDIPPLDVTVGSIASGKTATSSPLNATLGSIAGGKTATASNVYRNDPSYAAGKAFDNDPNTRWATDEGTSQAWLEVDLGRPMSISRIAIDEAFPGRVQSFELQYKDGDQYQTFYSGTGLGSNFETSDFKPITAQIIRLNILKAPGGPTISEFQLFGKP